MERQEKIQIAILILIAIFIMLLISTIVILVKNVDEIKSDPVQYAIDNDFYDSCSCMKGGSQLLFKDMGIQYRPS